jgi:hypothetical protein
VTDLHRCDKGGLLVGSLEWVGSAQDAWWSLAPSFGCSRLRCSACGNEVQHRVPDPDGVTRLYSCACRTVGVTTASPAPNPAPDAPVDESTAWACAGHPPVVHGHFDDAPVADATTAVSSLLDRNEPVHAALQGHRGFRAARLARVVASDDVRSQVMEAIVGAAVGQDRRRRARASNAVAMWPFEPAVTRFTATIATRPELFAGADPDAPSSTMAWWLLQIAVRRVDPSRDRDPHALEILRHFALSPPGIGERLFNLAWADPAWTLHHAGEILRADPARGWRRLLLALQSDATAAARVTDEALASGVAGSAIRELVERDFRNRDSAQIVVRRLPSPR